MKTKNDLIAILYLLRARIDELDECWRIHELTYNKPLMEDLYKSFIEVAKHIGDKKNEN